MLLLAPALPLLATSVTQALLVGQPAPRIAPDTWVLEEPTQGEARREARSGQGRAGALGFLAGKADPGARDLDQLHGQVVLVHALDWGSDSGVPELIRDLARANADRGLVVRSIAPALDEEAAKEHLQGWGVDWPVALVPTEEGSVWATWALASADDVALVGRGGELAWIGTLDDEKDLLQTAAELLARYPVPALEGPMPDELGRALEEYWSGRLSKAASLAESAARSGKSGSLSKAAQALAAAVAEAEASWPRDLGAARRESQELRYLQLLAAIQQAFPRGDAADAAEEIDKEARRDTFFPGPLRDGQTYLELQAIRPILFPARKDSRGDAFAKKLEKMLQATVNDIPSTQAARALLERYREAR